MASSKLVIALSCALLCFFGSVKAKENDSHIPDIEEIIRQLYITKEKLIALKEITEKQNNSTKEVILAASSLIDDIKGIVTRVYSIFIPSKKKFHIK